MKAFFSYLLIALVLLQTLSREVLLVNFALHRTELTAQFCVNKARPQLHCKGKCYFAKLVKKQQEHENKAPNSVKEKLEMLPNAFSGLLPPAPAWWATAPTGYGSCVALALLYRAQRGVFQPPQA